MIKVAENPQGMQILEGKYPQGSTEHAILQILSSSGKIYSYPSINALEFELELRAATVSASKELDQSGMGFAVFRKSRCNPDYWTRTAEGGFLLKNANKPSAAIMDIYRNGPSYATECATAILIVFYKAVLDLFHDERFNQVFPKIELMNWHHVDPVFESIGIMEPAVDFLPGDRRYFMNPDVDPVTPEWQGENVIMLNSDLYYGHGIGIRNAAEIIEALNKNRIEDAGKSAYLMNLAGRPDFQELFRIRESASSDAP